MKEDAGLIDLLYEEADALEIAVRAI